MRFARGEARSEARGLGATRLARLPRARVGVKDRIVSLRGIELGPKRLLGDMTTTMRFTGSDDHLQKPLLCVQIHPFL